MKKAVQEIKNCRLARGDIHITIFDCINGYIQRHMNMVIIMAYIRAVITGGTPWPCISIKNLSIPIYPEP